MQTAAAGYALTCFTAPKRQLVTWKTVGQTTTQLQPVMLPVHGFSLSTCRYISIQMILDDFSLFPV
jgi:hypothetical protein